MNYVIHIFLFIVSWGACVFGAMNGAPWLSFGVSATCLTLAVLLSSPRRRVDFLKVGLVIFIGVVCEYFNELLPFYKFIPESKYPPVWILCFWPAFSILFIETLEPLYRRNFFVRYAAGLLGGMTYWSGEQLGLIQFEPEKALTMGAFAALWAVQFVLILKVAHFIDRRFSSY